MNKMAIFVEGYTEVVFVDKLIKLIAEKTAVDIRWHRIQGGKTCAKTARQMKASGPLEGHEHFIIIYDCGGDDAVKSRMIQEYEHLVRSGYSKIVCLRDVFDKYTRDQIPTLESLLPKYVKTKPIQPYFILSIMEVEAWFLAEHTHFPKFDGQISVQAISDALGFNPETDDMQLRNTPANDLHNCYMLAGKPYRKGNAEETVDALDCEMMYYWPPEKFPYLRKLCEIIETFFKV